MKLLYISQHRFIRDKLGRIFSTGAMDAEYFYKYLGVFDSVCVIGLLYDETEKNSMKHSSKTIEETEVITFSFVHSNSFQFYNPKVIKRLKSLINTKIETHDIIGCKTASGAGLANWIARKSNKPYFIEVVGCAWDSLWNYGLKGKIIALPYFLMQKKIVWNAPFVIYVTNSFLQSRYKTKGKTAAISDVTIEGKTSNPWMTRTKSFTEKIVIGTAGSVQSPYKGQRYVIEAISNLKNAGHGNYIYRLAGGGNCTALKQLAIKKGVANCIIFDGVIPHNKMGTWYSSLDLYIQPSLTEGLPRALLEAMSYGLPSLGARVGGIPELLESSCLFRKRNPNEIERLLIELTSKDLSKASQRNFLYSNQYSMSILKKKRTEFLELVKCSLEQ